MIDNPNDPQTPPKLVLIVDDDPLVRSTLTAYLRNQPWHTECVADGNEAILAVHKMPVSVLVTDILMPNRDGLETIRGLRASYPELRIVAISGGSRVGSFDYLAIAAQFGADVLLHKPFTREQFLTALEPDDA